MRLRHIAAGLVMVTILVSGTAVTGTVLAHDDPEKPGHHANQKVAPNGQAADVTVNPAELRSRADKLLEKRRAEKAQRKVEVPDAAGRQKACQARESGINRKIERYQQQAGRHLARYDATFAKLKSYQTTQNIQVENYEALVTAVDARRADVAATITVLKTTDATIDCSAGGDPATDLAVVKTSVANSCEALRAYRTAIKDVLAALMTAASDTKQTARESGAAAAPGGTE